MSDLIRMLLELAPKEVSQVCPELGVRKAWRHFLLDALVRVELQNWLLLRNRQEIGQGESPAS